jgi:hypothetical protein
MRNMGCRIVLNDESAKRHQLRTFPEKAKKHRFTSNIFVLKASQGRFKQYIIEKMRKVMTKNMNIVEFEVLTAASTKIAVFWVVAPCSLVEVHRRFRGTCCLHHQGHHSDDKNSKRL